MIERASPTSQSTTSYLLAALLIVPLSWLGHELAHYVMGSALGYSMMMTLNSTYPWDGTATILDVNLISAAGPLFTIAEAFLGYYLLKRYSDRRLYLFVFVPFFMRLLALGISFTNPNDEARISMDLGIGMFTLPVLVCALLLFLVYRSSVREQYTARFQAISALATLLISTGIIVLDNAFHIVLLAS